MKIGHIHIGFQDLEAAVEWMGEHLEMAPGFCNQSMAAFYFDETGVVFDKSDGDTSCSIAISAMSCDSEFKRLTQKGAKVIEFPADQSWGVRTAYLMGPGKLTFEIEEELK